MISSHPSFVWPTDQNVKIWRYTDLAKFASLLFTSKLFFSRASFLGDPYEGSITKTQHDLRRYIIANRTVDPSLEMWKDMTDDALRQFFETQAGNLFNPILSKRKSFSHEQEIRAVALECLSAEISGSKIKKNMDAGGLPISIDLNLLIERVYVSPTAAPWFEDVIRHLANSHDIAAPVVKSSLASRPLY